MAKRKNAVYGDPLTPTELKVLGLIAKGLSSKEVAEELVCSKHTVGFHVGRIHVKLGVHNRVQALRVAIELGLMPFEPVFGRNLQ